jgi:RNA polymerase sigma factor (sigma-70 family)
MEVDEVLHRAVLRWAPEETPPQGDRLSTVQVKTFSLVCRNVLIDEVRAFARRRRLAEEARHLPRRSEREPEASLSDRELAERALSRLSPFAREVLQLRYFGGLSFDEIGQRLGKRADAVRQVHGRALRELRDVLRQEHLE